MVARALYGINVLCVNVFVDSNESKNGGCSEQRTVNASSNAPKILAFSLLAHPTTHKVTQQRSSTLTLISLFGVSNISR